MHQAAQDTQYNIESVHSRWTNTVTGMASLNADVSATFSISLEGDQVTSYTLTYIQIEYIAPNDNFTLL